MQYRNDGNREDYIVQNQFTAYLQVALKRRKKEYISKFYRLQKHEQPMEPESVLFSDNDRNDELYNRIEYQAECGSQSNGSTAGARAICHCSKKPGRTVL